MQYIPDQLVLVVHPNKLFLTLALLLFLAFQFLLHTLYHYKVSCAAFSSLTRRFQSTHPLGRQLAKSVLFAVVCLIFVALFILGYFLTSYFFSRQQQREWKEAKDVEAQKKLISGPTMQTTCCQCQCHLPNHK